MIRSCCIGIALSVFTAPTIAQTPAAPAPAAPAAPAGATSTIDQDKRGTAAPAQIQRTQTSTNPGVAPLPMNIKIQGEGIKLPACTAESREGEACKK